MKAFAQYLVLHSWKNPFGSEQAFNSYTNTYMHIYMFTMIMYK